MSWQGILFQTGVGSRRVCFNHRLEGGKCWWREGARMKDAPDRESTKQRDAQMEDREPVQGTTAMKKVAIVMKKRNKDRKIRKLIWNGR